MKPRKSIRRTSTARARQLREYRKVKEAFLGRRFFCQICSRFLQFNQRQLHHWAGRTGRLLCYEPAFWCLCPMCHATIHADPKRAVVNGWLAPMGTFNDYNRAVAHYEAHK